MKTKISTHFDPKLGRVVMIRRRAFDFDDRASRIQSFKTSDGTEMVRFADGHVQRFYKEGRTTHNKKRRVFLRHCLRWMDFPFRNPKRKAAVDQHMQSISPKNPLQVTP